MLCHSCGHQNKENASFCTECGGKLTKPQTDRRPCPRCGFENALGSNYCSECGLSLVGNKRKQKLGAKSKNSRDTKNQTPVLSSTAKIVTVMAAVVVVSIFLVKSFVQRQTVVQQPPVAATSLNPIMDGQTLSVAKQFRCSCGNCDNALEECSCPTAENEKKYIARILAGGMNVDDAIAKVDSVYGWIKPEFKRTTSEGS